ncbi:MAG TPA: sugar ABC transporter ATP-binding protein [bacterium]
MTPDSLLKMCQIRKTFPGVVALDNVDFELRKGEVHILLGENGAGKSTLMKILSGAYQKTSGQIFLNSKAIEIKSPKHAQQLGISTIYQELNLIPSLSAEENIFLGREPTRLGGFINHRRVSDSAGEILKELGIRLDSRARVKDLGIAEKQMVEVAKALSLECKILIMDEPTSALAQHEIKELFAAIRRLKQKGVSIIYISHRLEELFEIGDRVTVLRDGRFVGTRTISEVDKIDLIKMMVNRDLVEQFPRVKAQVGEEVLRVDALNVAGVLHDINFKLHKGEVLGLAGLLGSGRTELARTLFGLRRVESGKIFIKNQVRAIANPRHAINLGIGFLTEDRKSEGLILGLSVKDNIVLPILDLLTRWGLLNQKRATATAEQFAGSLRIKTPDVNQKVQHLSGGNQQKVVLSKWLCSNADIFIFDEPTRGIDVGSKVEIYQLMNQLTTQGAAIIMISSELPEILGMSNRILVMHEGRITGAFNAAEATQEKILNCALGESHDN